MYNPYTPAQPTKYPSLSRREKYWLHRYLSTGPDNPLLANFGMIRSTETIVEDLTERWDKDHISELLESWKQYFIPAEELEWISPSNNRLLIWLINELPLATPRLETTPYIPDPSAVGLPHRHVEIIASIDSWAAPLDQKRQIISQIRQTWQKEALSTKQLKWLDTKNEQQIDWAADYIEKSSLWQKHSIRFACPRPLITKEKSAYVLGFLDHLHKIGADSQELFLNKMRKTWQQKKYRSSAKAKKQVYFSLSDEAQKQLSRLEKTQRRTKNRIIEDLIRQAATREGAQHE